MESYQWFLILLIFVYWLYCIIIFQQKSKKFQVKSFIQQSKKFFVATVSSFVLAWLFWEISEKFPDNSNIMLILVLLSVLFLANATILFAWHILKGGYILFPFPYIISKYEHNTAIMISLKKLEFVGSHKLFLNVCLVISIILIVIPTIFFVVIVVCF